MLWIALADDASDALALDDLAVLANRLDAASYFQFWYSPIDVQIPGSLRARGISEVAL
jgi:hypothetical protein